jgi:hypothetical protein
LIEGNVRIEKGWSLVRDVKLPMTNVINRTTETIDVSGTEQTPRKEKKRKHDKVAEVENDTPRKHGEKSHKQKDKHKDKDREKHKEDKHSHREKEKKHKSKHSHSHS